MSDIRGRYNPFNLTAFNKRLRHSLLLDMLTNPENNDDHDSRYYTKNEVNDIMKGNTFDFFLNNTNSDISAPTQYFVMDPTETGEGESTFSDTITGDDFLIDSWATSTSEPTFSALVSGIYAFHIHAETTTGANVGSVRLYWELYRRTHPGGVETLLITSEESNILTGVETEYDPHGTLATDVVLDVTDRLVLKVYANIEISRPTDPLVTLTAEGTTAAHFEVVTTITAFDDRYVEVAGDTMTGPLNINGTLTVTVDDRSTITRLLDSDGDVGTPLRLMRDVEDTRLATGDGTRLQVMIRGNDVDDSTRNLFATNAFIEGTVADKRSCVDFKTARGGVLFTFLSADSNQNTTLLGDLTLPTGSLTAGVGEDAGDLIITANGDIRLNSNVILDSGDMSGIDDLTMDGIFNNGTLSIVSGTITNVAIMQGDDLDILAGTGDYLSSGTIEAGAITGTSFTDGTFSVASGVFTDVVSISSSGDLALNPDGTQDVTIGANALSVGKNPRFEISGWDTGGAGNKRTAIMQIQASGLLNFDIVGQTFRFATNSSGFEVMSNAQGNVDVFNFSTISGRNKQFRLYGYNAGADAAKYASFSMTTDDFLTLDRQDSNVLGFKINMPVIVTGNIDATDYKVGSVAGIDFSGAVANITIVKGIVTAASGP